MQKSIAIILLSALSVPALGMANPTTLFSRPNTSISTASAVLANCTESCTTTDRGSGRRNQQYNQTDAGHQANNKRRGSGRVDPDATRSKKRGSGRVVTDPKLPA
ncbi:MAG: hypothetical protein AAGG51_24780 [Cyanobacteria bacterium P01_G01_bin.54]